VLAGLQILPRDNAWNERIDNRPLLTNSAAMISQIISDLASDRRTLRPFYEMNYVLVPDSQPAPSDCVCRLPGRVGPRWWNGA
jgi:hypothetical protein